MTRVIVTTGLPASGKTTWVNEYVKKHPEFRNINRDNIREMLFGKPYKFSKQREKDVTRTQLLIAQRAIDDGNSVVISDTNLNPKTFNKWKKFAADNAIEFNVQSFNHVSAKTCIERDLVRPNSVGEKVIMGMYSRYIAGNRQQYTGTPGMPKAIQVDIDGTLAHNNGARGWYEWHRVGEDSLDLVIAEMVRKYHNDRYSIILLSGRDAVCRPETEKWLVDHKVPYDALYMRSEGNCDADHDTKERLFWEYVAPRYDVKFILDDRNQVVDRWREMGMKCLQVAPGDF
jgi:predicted kinase